MRLLSLLAVITALSFGLSSCTEDELPLCIDNILTDFRTDACDGGELTTWTFKGETVYCFDYGACQPDKSIDIYTASCEIVCQMGGANGTVDCDGAVWGDAATLIESIYVK